MTYCFTLCFPHPPFLLQDEIKPTDGHETQSAYERLYVYMSADTFDKIDAAISVMELLITSISVSQLLQENELISSVFN